MNCQQAIRVKSQFLARIDKCKIQGKSITKMDRVGGWLDDNIHLFYKNDPSKSVEQNFALWTKMKQKLWNQAELIITKQEKMLKDKKYMILKKLLESKAHSYNQKITFIDSRIEKNIRYFKSNYYSQTQEVFKMRMLVKSRMKK